MNAYFLDRHNFAPFGIEHWLMVTAYSFVAIYLIYYCQKSANPQQYQRPLIWFLSFITLLQLAKPFIRLHYGMFDIKDDLPLHLCNMLPLLLRKSVLVFGIFILDHHRHHPIADHAYGYQNLSALRKHPVLDGSFWAHLYGLIWVECF